MILQVGRILGRWNKKCNSSLEYAKVKYRNDDISYAFFPLFYNSLCNVDIWNGWIYEKLN